MTNREAANPHTTEVWEVLNRTHAKGKPWPGFCTIVQHEMKSSNRDGEIEKAEITPGLGIPKTGRVVTLPPTNMHGTIRGSIQEEIDLPGPPFLPQMRRWWEEGYRQAWMKPALT